MMSGHERAIRRGGAGFKENRSVPSAADATATRYKELCRKSLPELFDIIEQSGWLVNNLFQVGGKMWRCNLRYIIEHRDQVRTYFHEFSDADTREIAVASAIWNMEQRRNDATRATGAVNAYAQPADLAVVLGARNTSLPGASKTHQFGEIAYSEEWKPEIEAAMRDLGQEILLLRINLQAWTRGR